MKKIAILLIILMTLTMMAGCTQQVMSDKDTAKEPAVSDTANDKTESTPEPTPKPTPKPTPEPTPEPVLMNGNDLNELLTTLPLAVMKTNYLVQDEKYKSLYPDMLQAIIQNNSNSDILNAVIGFVAWDKNRLPLKLKGSIDFTDGSYIKLVNFSDINLVPEDKYGEDSGFEIDENLEVDSFKAIVVSYETFEGEEWTNPYYEEFCELYEGKKYDEQATVNVVIEEQLINDNVDDDKAKTDDNNLEDVKKLEEALINVELAVVKTEYVVQDEKYKSLYPDMLQAVIQNNTDKDILNAVIGFVAWDKNGLPLKLKGSIDFTDGSYIKLVKYDGINLVPEDKYGDDSGYEIDENLEVDSFKAIVVSYETFEGEEWTNPHYEEFCELYEGKRLVK